MTSSVIKSESWRKIAFMTGGFSGWTIWVLSFICIIEYRKILDHRPLCLFFFLIDVTVRTQYRTRSGFLLSHSLFSPLLLRSAIGTGGCRGMWEIRSFIWDGHVGEVVLGYGFDGECIWGEKYQRLWGFLIWNSNWPWRRVEEGEKGIAMGGILRWHWQMPMVMAVRASPPMIFLMR